MYPNIRDTVRMHIKRLNGIISLKLPTKILDIHKLSYAISEKIKEHHTYYLIILNINNYNYLSSTYHLVGL